MFKKYFHIILVGLPLFCLAQNPPTNDSTKTNAVGQLYKNLIQAKNDSIRMRSLDRLGFYYERINSDSATKYYRQAIDLARQKGDVLAESRILASYSGLLEHQGKFPEAFEILFKSLAIAEENHSAYDIARGNRRISGIYFELQNYPKAIAYLLVALTIDEASHLPDKVAIDHYALADAYEKADQLDSARFHIDQALPKEKLLYSMMQSVYPIDGHIKQKKGDYAGAAASYSLGFQAAQPLNDLLAFSQICADFSNLFLLTNRKDSAIIYALKGFEFARQASYRKGVMVNGNLLASLYDSTQPALALHYYKIAAAAKDSLYGLNSTQAIQDLVAKEETRQKELQDAKLAFQNQLKLYGLLGGLGVLFIIAFILYRNNRQKQKANVVLQEQKATIETTLNELKSTQAQLIQSEKMASLGQLTAGIAHEIQNPLNFVNNFSEVNGELIEELKSQKEKLKNERDEQTEDEILNDIAANMEKIIHHGKRADAIVKGMLQHSRTSTGQKEPTDINALADEYLKLAYHGLRAKDKNFNVTMKTDFDDSIGKINIIPQDIGRVLLNLYNNAFYATHEKQKNTGGEYAPIVTVSTRKADGHVEIKVTDNGVGIPPDIVDKIFQPFFTTKPTGLGTGLGLSLAYDIVKAHGGEISAGSRGKEETAGNEGTTFIIQLPFR